MRRLFLLALPLLAPAVSFADVRRAVDEVLLPGVAAFADAADALESAAAADCRRAAVLPAYHAARDAWAAVGDIRLGPTEGAALTIAFWPDDRASGPRALRSALTTPPESIETLPASARGFTALDLLLGDQDLLYDTGDPGCTLVQALAADLAMQGRSLLIGWRAYAPLLRAPGGPGNTSYLDEREAAQALFTQTLATLEVTRTARLGRPLGTFDRPRPTRAEAWRTARSLPNALAAVGGTMAMAEALSDAPLPRSRAALAAVEAAADRIADPSFQDIDDPQARLRLEVLHQRVAELQEALADELGVALGVSAGFNALDGD